MELNINIQPKEDYLYISARGTYDPQKAKALLVEAVEAASALGLHNMLVDCREIEGRLPTMMEDFSYAETVAEVTCEERLRRGLPVLRLAYVVRNPHPRFAETVARNRGVIVKSTNNFDEALGWLLKTSSADKPAAGDA